ncbi:hypothetical protein DCAR_0100758 [Daucus carota subsp. sativus]|uniref:Uncharacterized protein n=1 Tax=Daucus carota subsp. sativus TaxID=79200 RepID=A0A166FWE4_DAUCS|nr:hypothetical protein DCAR_0100758 [Daucus carota subsp. sativus]
MCISTGSFLRLEVGAFTWEIHLSLRVAPLIFNKVEILVFRFQLRMEDDLVHIRFITRGNFRKIDM